MKNIILNRLFLTITVALCLISCNDSLKDEQFEQMVSFKAEPNDQGVTWAYLRYNANGKVHYELPLIISGSTSNAKTRTVHIGLDSDTLGILNREQYGDRQELYFKQLDSKYYSFPKTIEVSAGQSTVTIPIDFTLGNLDQSDKWILPLRIMDSPDYCIIRSMSPIKSGKIKG